MNCSSSTKAAGRSGAERRYRGGRSLIAAVCLAMAAGCSQPAAPVAEAPAPPTAEERFTQIVKTLKQRLEDDKLGTGNLASEFDAPVGTPIANATVRVTSELLPEGEGPRRAVICLATPGARVTVVLPTPTDEERDAEATKRNSQISDLQDELDGVPDLDSLLVPSSDGLASRLGSSPIHEINPGDSLSCFELEHQDGRWKLMTELDRENEPFYAVAIEYALRKQ